SSIDVTRGDTVEVTGIFRDAMGGRISGVMWGVTDEAAIFDVQPIKDTKPDTYLLRGVAPGEGELGVWLALPAGSSFEWKQLSAVPVRVREWPAARIEIDPLAYRPYAESAFRLTGRVITTHETEHVTAVISWSSGDPEIISLTSEGGATLLRPGRGEIRAEAEGVASVLELEVLTNPVAGIGLRLQRAEVRTGDVVRLEPKVTDQAGRLLSDVQVAYSVSAVDGPSGGAVVEGDGAFVANKPGIYQVIATAGGRSASDLITASPRGGDRAAKLIGRGPVAHVETSDLWVFEGRDGRDYAYTGTHIGGGGQRMFVWDVTDPTSPVLTDSVVVDARAVNDVKVNEDATIAVITREGASNRRNGIVLLDLSEPAHPTVLSEFTDSLTGGVHNTWINGEIVYAINDGTNAVHIIDIADPAHPRHVGRWELRPGEQNKYLHDIWVKDGLAYVSYWDDGLVILDVGAGLKGGTPHEPKFVSLYKYPVGNTHVAFRYRDYVFVGDEFLTCPDCINGPRGYIHVIDVSDIDAPNEVARFEVPEAGAHNIWVEDDLLYIAYYQGGLRVVDVSGELRGDLYAQGRQVGWFHSGGQVGEAFRPNSPMAWGPQPHKGYIFFSDHFSGLWVVQVGPPKDALVP
ncbi:MAG: LVIVD repeat-containing protein, partial [Acidimicrobiia bacterium]